MDNIFPSGIFANTFQQTIRGTTNETIINPRYFRKAIIIMLFVSKCYSQNNLDRASINLIEKNMTIYRIYHKGYEISGRSIDIAYALNKYLLDKGEHYDVNIIKLDSLQKKCPKKHIELYVIDNNFYSKISETSDSKKIVSFTHRMPYENLLERKILIGYDKSSKETIFISGNIFKNCISQDFNLDIKNNASFIVYLEFKLFNYDLNNIRFIKQKKGYLIFEAYSKTLNDVVDIKINLSNFGILC